ncbi:hypothetical protein POM88_000609 [Heracleum sosnowskyi]|uniref:Reverse transcriptase zinc-binding domain-containing protein n=1 Tax=Heracleum sosnowskyi TaxID=360622 RepID=A0AAD8JBG8_9APIA|nr:hypothetical protein POM88_000609 [Heracleum sosnowskyi]
MAKAFPKLYSLSLFKHASLKQFLDVIRNPRVSETQLWKRNLRCWEQVEIPKLLSHASNFIPCQRKDQMMWAITNKPFNVKDCYDILSGGNQIAFGAYNLIWSLKIPPKVHYFLWSLLSDSLPTAHLLQKRFKGNLILSKCLICHNSDETQDHIFWGCEYATWAWHFVEVWWEVKVSKNNFWSSFHKFKSPSVKAAWGIVLAATLWTIWLSRNQTVFENNKLGRKALEDLLLLRTLHWCESVMLLDQSQSNIWASNPAGLILSNSKTVKKNLWTENSSLMGFIDGSWKKRVNQDDIAGIGGHLYDREGNMILMFSGPVSTTSALVSEMEALWFLLEKINNSPWSQSKVKIHSDCQEPIDIIQESKFSNNSHWLLSKDLLSLMGSINFELIKIPRMLNDNADSLATRGAMRTSMIVSWC